MMKVRSSRTRGPLSSSAWPAHRASTETYAAPVIIGARRRSFSPRKTLVRMGRWTDLNGILPLATKPKTLAKRPTLPKYPRLRSVETLVVPDPRHGRVLVLRDTHGIASGHACIPPALVPVV